MSYQIADTVDDLQGPGKGCQHGPRLARSLHLLVFSSVSSILFFCFVNSDVMNDGRCLQNFLGVRIEILLKADQSREFMDLQKVLDPFYILVVVACHFI